MKTERVLSLVLALLTWHAAAKAAMSPLLPSPADVAVCLWREAADGPLLRHLAATLRRVLISFPLSLLSGGLLGWLMGRHPRLDRWFDPWLQLLLGVPAMVVAILSYVWLGLGETAAVLAVSLSKMPSMAVIFRQGARAHDRELDEMARLFRFSLIGRLRHLYLPELAPFLLASVRSGLALVWKIILLVEMLGRSDGIGFQLSVYFQLFDIRHLLAYSLSFMAVPMLIEATLLRWMDRHVARWQA
ncbi:MAG TPA: ABC transporter permease subunit [Candidatus Sulfotelmatobacter sp.]|nr:ABC transporter permease subunit [Candidatus Sulfotelmatobacter sp.]